MKFVISTCLLCFLSLALADQGNPDPSDIVYYLYTRSNQDNGAIISYTDGSINSNFDSSRRTYVIAHGFSENVPGSSWMSSMKDLILGKEDANVILMDWGVLSAAPRYDQAAPNTYFAGEDLATLLSDLASRGGLGSGNLHLIGFSLGAQVVGVAGNKFPDIDRITGLDPAEPLFDDEPEANRLDKGDANFVDVLHTNSGILVTGHLSFFESLGHVDFYPNGGHDQRGCPSLVGEVIDNLADMTLDDIDACSHGRAPAYFITSLERSDFVGYECADYETYQDGLCTTTSNILGWDVDRSKQGNFYMETLVDSPYVASQVMADFAIDTTTSGSLVLRNTISGLDTDEFQIFGGLGSVSAGSVVTKMITASDGGVTNMGIELQYDGSDPSSISISSINSQDIVSGENACIGTGLTLNSGSPMTVSATSGSC